MLTCSTLTHQTAITPSCVLGFSFFRRPTYPCDRLRNPNSPLLCSLSVLRHPQSCAPFGLGQSICTVSLPHPALCSLLSKRDATAPPSMLCILTWENIPYVPPQDEVNEGVYQNEPAHPAKGSVVSNHWGLVHVVPLQSCREELRNAIRTHLSQGNTTPRRAQSLALSAINSPMPCAS